MTTVYLRTNESEREPSSGLLLDWFGRGGSSTVSGSLVTELIREVGAPHARYVDLLRLAVAAYGADKVVLRKSSSDRWTRRLRLHVPASDSARWSSASAAYSEALAFLTGDEWQLRFRRGTSPEASTGVPPRAEVDTVSLFSGGLDSLVGAIDLLEAGRNIVLVGHYDSNLLLPRQKVLFERLREAYGADRVRFRPFYLRPLGARPAQARPLPQGRERTTRSRSFLFIAAAGVTASAARLAVVHVPENGYIGLNIPLEPSRIGACSTRTTHPHFLRLLADAFAEAEIDLAVENPYRLKTKGEVLEQCRNRALLLAVAPATVSCAHPEVGRWSGESYANCGYCYPCLMRRVSLHRLGADAASDYRVDVGAPGFLSRQGRRTEHLRSILQSVRRPTNLTEVLSAGPLPRGETLEFAALYERGRDEIRAWLDAAVPASA
jgi:hypothetical protein